MTTQFAAASYQEVIDLHTESDTVSVIGIHTPQGDTPRKMFGGFFDQFKKFKYLGCSIKLVPAARLPADPLQVSYEAGATTIDPRDMLNPLMFHGCHGNDMGVILNRLYSLNSVDGFKTDSAVIEQDDTQWSLVNIAAGKFPNFQLEDLYYKALTDNTWKKAHPQRGFRKNGLRPLVYKMATNLQMLGSGQSLMGYDDLGIPTRPIVSDGDVKLAAVQSGRQFFTPGLTGLGWLDTRNVLTTEQTLEYDITGLDADEAAPIIEAAMRKSTLDQQIASESSLPLVYMGMILLPPAYKTEQYFRMIINHHFAFKDFRGISFSNNLDTTPAYFDANDPNFEQGGSEVDPDDPGSGGGDDPGDDPDDPLSGANVLYNLTDAGTIQFDSKTFDTYGTFQYEEVDYQPYDYKSSTYKRGFLVQQSDRLNEVSTPKVGVVFVYTTPIGGFIGSSSITDVTNVAKWNGDWWAYGTVNGSTKWYSGYRFVSNNINAETTLSPENSTLSALLGSTTALEDVSYGS